MNIDFKFNNGDCLSDTYLKSVSVLNNHLDELKVLFPFANSLKEYYYAIKNNTINKPKCLCGSDKIWDSKHNIYKFCSRECFLKNQSINQTGKKPNLLSKEQYKLNYEKVKKTNLEKYGVENSAKSDHYKKKILEQSTNNLQRIIGDSYEIIHYDNKNQYKIKHLVCNLEFDINPNTLHTRKANSIEICLNCLPKYESNFEKEVEQILIEFGVSYQKQVNIGKYRIDFLVDSNLIIECDGLYWHTLKNNNYHQDKALYFRDNNFEFMNIWEDDFLNKKDIIKSLILSKIGGNNKIYARKCDIRIPDVRDVRDFLNKNHHQGFVWYHEVKGLYYNNELVQLLTLRNMGDIMEVSRVSTKLGITVIGGLSKLMNLYLDKKIYTYCDLGIFNAKSFIKLGFKLDSITKPSFWWCKSGRNPKRENRINFQKHKIKNDVSDERTADEIMKDNNYHKLFGYGNYKLKNY